MTMEVACHSVTQTQPELVHLVHEGEAKVLPTVWVERYEFSALFTVLRTKDIANIWRLGASRFVLNCFRLIMGLHRLDTRHTLE